MWLFSFYIWILFIRLLRLPWAILSRFTGFFLRFRMRSCCYCYDFGFWNCYYWVNLKVLFYLLTFIFLEFFEFIVFSLLKRELLPHYSCLCTHFALIGVSCFVFYLWPTYLSTLRVTLGSHSIRKYRSFRWWIIMAWTKVQRIDRSLQFSLLLASLAIMGQVFVRFSTADFYHMDCVQVEFFLAIPSLVSSSLVNFFQEGSFKVNFVQPYFFMVGFFQVYFFQECFSKSIVFLEGSFLTYFMLWIVVYSILHADNYFLMSLLQY